MSVMVVAFGFGARASNSEQAVLRLISIVCIILIRLSRTWDLEHIVVAIWPRYGVGGVLGHTVLRKRVNPSRHSPMIMVQESKAIAFVK
jgi:hypothetical protein